MNPHPLVGRKIIAVNIREGYIQLDDGARLYLDSDEVSILKNSEEVGE